MTGKRIGLPLLLLLVLFFSISMITAVQPAKAQGNTWVRWLIDVDFVTSAASPGNIDMDLIVQLGHTTQSGNKVIDDEHIEPVSCLVVGTPTFKNGRVFLDGNSYFQCNLPAPKEIALAKWGIFIPDSAQVRLAPFVSGRARLDSNSGAENPIFHRDDIQFGLSYDDATVQSNINLIFDQEEATSSSFPAPLNNTGRIVNGRFEIIGLNLFAPRFAAGGATLASTPATISNPIIISNLGSTVYVGYSPVTGEYFEGALGSLTIDPGCETSG